MSAADDESSVDPERSAHELENAVRRGTRWVLAGQIVSQVISFLVLAVLYRLVAPDQYGLLGMVVPALLLARILGSFGLNVATIQRRHLTDGQLTSLFWISLLVSLVAAAALALCGPLLAWVYRTPDLVSLCAALSGTLVVAAVGAQHQALLERKLSMQRLAVARIIAQVAGGAAAIALAVRGAGVWALVAQQYGELLTLTLLAWCMESWRPRRFGRGEPVFAMIRFGGYYSLSSFSFFFAQNADKILIALLLGSTRQGQAALGMYSQAFNLMMKPVLMVTTPVTGIMLPALARVAHQRGPFTDFVARFYRIVGIVLLPAGVGLIFVADDLMLVLGGTRWAPAGQMLMILAPTILAQGLLNIAGSVFAAAGRAGRLLIGALLTALLLAVGCTAGYWLGGCRAAAPWGPTLGVAAGYSLVTVALVMPYLVYCFRTVGISTRQVLRPLVPPALSALMMGAAVAALYALLVHWEVPALPRVIACVVVGTCVYSATAVRELRWLVRQLRDTA